MQAQNQRGMLPDPLVLNIVSMLSSRRVREALGYTVDRCIRYRVPSCPLAWSNLDFQKHLSELCACRLKEEAAKVFHRESNLLVKVQYHEGDEEYVLEVIRYAHVLEPDPRRVETEWRTYVIGRFERTTQQYRSVHSYTQDRTVFA